QHWQRLHSMPRSSECPLRLLFVCVTYCTQTYSLNTGAADCNACNQQGLTCVAGVAQVQAGFYAYLEGNDTLVTVQCPPDLCEGGTTGSAQTSCQSGRWQSPQNLLCGQCEAGPAPRKA